MGLGKTFVGSEKMMQLGGRVNLVICQKSKVDDWVQHFKTYYRSSKVDVYDLTNKKSWEWFLNKPCDFVYIGIINYDLIFRRQELSKIPIDTIMLDESSLIQNDRSKRSAFILKKLQHENCILLSGTPTGGKYERLWSQCKLLGWDISKTAYWNTYVDYHFNDHLAAFPVKVIDGYKNVDRLKKKLREHGAVFMKSDEVFDLPDQIFTDVKVKNTAESRQFQKKSVVEIDGEKIVGDTLFTKMLYSRMLCGSLNTAKVKAFSDLVDSTDDRLIVFYNFVNELDVLRAAVGDRPISVVSGDEKDLSEYENSENSVTFIQYQAGAMGLNLQKANKIVYFTPPLSSELFEQSKKRTHRIGQARTCYYYRMICKGSLEEKIYKMLEMRQDFTERLFENG